MKKGTSAKAGVLFCEFRVIFCENDPELLLSVDKGVYFCYTPFNTMCNCALGRPGLESKSEASVIA